MKRFFTPRNSSLTKLSVKLHFCIFTIFVLFHQPILGQISITSGSPVTQNFNGMASSATATLPTGFVVSSGAVYSAGTTATTLAYGTSGTGIVTGTSSGGVINWANGLTASSTDRGLGFLTAGSFSSPRSIMLKIDNNTGSIISKLSISFDYEKYRSGSRAITLAFFHGIDGSTWAAENLGDLSSAADANNTVISNPPVATSKSLDLTGLSIANGSSYYIRWAFTGTGGSTNGQGWGLDNFSVTATVCPSISATFTGATTICAGASTNLSVAVTGGVSPYTLTLDNSGGTATTATPVSKSVLPIATTAYTATVTDANGCPATVTGNTQTVTVNTPSTSATGTLSELCTTPIDGWTSYGVGNNIGFSIHWSPDGTLSTANAAAKAAAAVTITLDGAPTLGGTTPNQVRSMKRYWNVATSAIDESVTVRFFYDPAEKTAVTGSPTASEFKWVKTTSTAFNPAVNIANGSTGLITLAGTEATIGGISVVEFTTTSFSGGTGVGAESAVLGVEMNGIKAMRDGQKNIIVWQTTTETNTAHFDIERSINGSTNWKTIGSIKAAGNSQTTKDYQYTDEAPLSISYYRLRSVDFDGKQQVSNVVSVQQKGSGKLQVSPTAATDKLMISTENDDLQTYFVFDLLGRNVLSGQIRGQKELFINTLSTGNYFLKVGTETVKFVKQ